MSLNVLSLGGRVVDEHTPMVLGKMTTQKRNWLSKLIPEFHRVHSSAYVYDHMGYTTMPESITPICPKHGAFRVQARAHLQGAPCPECDPRRVPFSKAIQRFRDRYGDRYDYSKVSERYVTFTDPAVEVICPEHGSFMVKPINHWRNTGSGCSDCQRRNHKVTQDEVVRRIRKAGQGHLLPPNFTYTNMLSRTRVVCPRHGEFYAYPVNLQRGHGCGTCSKLSSNEEAAWIDALASELPRWKVYRGHRATGVPTAIDAVFKSPSGKYVGVEYDGSYWHGQRGSYEKDVRKTQAMKSAGLKVVRLRAVEPRKRKLRDIPCADANFHVPNCGPYAPHTKSIAAVIIKLGRK